MSDPTPKLGDTILVGTIGISDQRYYWLDTQKGQEAAIAWMKNGGAVTDRHRHVYRVHVEVVEELVITPPVPARLVNKCADGWG